MTFSDMRGLTICFPFSMQFWLNFRKIWAVCQEIEMICSRRPRTPPVFEADRGFAEYRPPSSIRGRQIYGKTRSSPPDLGPPPLFQPPAFRKSPGVFQPSIDSRKI